MSRFDLAPDRVEPSPLWGMLPPSFDREDYPWDSPYYSFPFRLEPLTLDSLACYIFAEMEPDLPGVIPGEGEEGRHFEQHDRARIV